MANQFIFASLLLVVSLVATAAESANTDLAGFTQQIAQHPGKSAVYVLDEGEEALMARAWLADHAQHSIKVQYFIWSKDNIGILAAESLLRAAERGVQVRVIVDDLLIDAPDRTLLALEKHPNVEIRIYNPKHSVGTRVSKRILNMLTDFRGFNQRMHDKTFIVDDMVLITGGRNMADEYFDYNQKYNFRDRDALVIGEVVKGAGESFDRFWEHPLSVPVEELYDGLGLMQKNIKVTDAEIQAIYQDMHAYANNPQNFSPQVRAMLEGIPLLFPVLSEKLVWCDAEFISDQPGKNDNQFSLGGGGKTTDALAQLIGSAQQQVTIQSPYLVLSRETQELFQKLRDRGVRIRINTNSLAATDNLQAFSGYQSQRKMLLKMGIEIYEYKANPEIQKIILKRYPELASISPTFAIHAKTLVVDSKVAYIGTFNLDPRSVNLNTEVGVIMRDERLARQIEENVVRDMQPENSWNAATDDPDRHNSLQKRSRIFFWRLMPIQALL
jgi:putative cardiolipin synthase